MLQPSIVIVEAESGELSAIFVGINPSEAEAVYESVRLDEKHVSVALCQGVHPRIVCHPAADAEQRKNAERDRKQREKQEAESHADAAKERLEKAKKELKEATANATAAGVIKSKKSEE